MALSKKELDKLIEDLSKSDPFKDWKSRDEQMYLRGLTIKKDYQLEEILQGYDKKFETIKNHYEDIRDGKVSYKERAPHVANSEEYLREFENKLKRIAEKYRDVGIEIKGRKNGQFIRNPIGTAYYIDFNGGNDGNLGTSIGQAWKTYEKYSTVTVRSAGDIAWIRANTEEVATAIINHDEDGTPAAPIQVFGCDAINDPWGDGSNIKPKINFNNLDYYLYFAADDLWRLTRLELYNTLANYLLFQNGGLSFYFKDLDIHLLNKVSPSGGINTYSYRTTVYDGCNFYDCKAYGLICGGSGFHLIKKCTFNKGLIAPSNYGMQIPGIARVKIIDSSFGQTTSHAIGDIRVTGGVSVTIIGGRMSANPFVYGDTYPNLFKWENVLFSGGTRPSSGQEMASVPFYKIEPETVIVRPGGSLESIKILPYNYIGPNCPIGLNGLDSENSHPIKLWMGAGAHTITIYIRAAGTWAVKPTSTQLFVEALYYPNAGNWDMSSAVSTEILPDDTTWTAFNVSFVCGRTGWVHLDVILGVYETSGVDGIYVDPTPIVS